MHFDFSQLDRMELLTRGFPWIQARGTPCFSNSVSTISVRIWSNTRPEQLSVTQQKGKVTSLPSKCAQNTLPWLYPTSTNITYCSWEKASRSEL